MSIGAGAGGGGFLRAIILNRVRQKAEAVSGGQRQVKGGAWVAYHAFALSLRGQSLVTVSQLPQFLLDFPG
jgi:hypothetical protein